MSPIREGSVNEAYAWQSSESTQLGAVYPDTTCSQDYTISSGGKKPVGTQQ